MSKVKIDYPQDKDIDALLKLEKACFKSDQLSRPQLRYLINQAKSTDIFIVKKKSSIIAYAIILFRKNSTIARLYSIAVDPNCQRSGIARLIYQHIERFITKQYCTEVRLEVRRDNHRAIRFYQRNGYLKFDEYKKYYGDGQDALRMRKVLKPHGIEIN